MPRKAFTGLESLDTKKVSPLATGESLVYYIRTLVRDGDVTKSSTERANAIEVPNASEKFTYEALVKAREGRKIKSNPLRILDDALRDIHRNRIALTVDEMVTNPTYEVMQRIVEGAFRPEFEGNNRNFTDLFEKYPLIFAALIDASRSDPFKVKKMVAAVEVKENLVSVDPSIRYFLYGKILRFGTDMQKEEMKKSILKEIHKGGVATIARLITYPHSHDLIDAAEELYAPIFEQKYGISLHSVRDNWIDDEVEHNLYQIQTVEKACPGGVKILREQFGIKEFMRYPFEALIDQAKQVEVDRPYGILIYPRKDDNGAFNSPEPGFNNMLYKFFSRIEKKYGLRIFEVESNRDIARAFLKLNRKYGAKNKIAFGIIGGHGDENTIEWGYGENDHLLTEHLSGEGIKRIRDFFVPNPILVLKSCSTGKGEESIGSVLSEKLQATVIAPDDDTALTDLSASFDENDSPRITARYSNAKGITYKDGKKVSEIEPYKS